MHTHIIWIYFFDDGTKLQLLDIGLSTQELMMLQDLHGAVVVNFERIG